MLFKLDHLFKYIKECKEPNEYSLTPYLVDDDDIHPAAIICPGGGYRMVCNHMEGKPIAQYLNSKGINAFVLHYRVKEKAIFPNPILDLVHAVKDLINNQKQYHVDMTNYAIFGFSAGGHMAGLYGTREYGYKKYDLPKPNLLGLIYPVITLDKNHTHLGTRKHFTKDGTSIEALEAGEVYKHVDYEYPKTFIWRGDIDKSVPHISSDLMIDTLEEYSIPHIGIKYDKVPHGVGLGLGTKAEGWIDQAINFWLNR